MLLYIEKVCFDEVSTHSIETCLAIKHKDSQIYSN